jgi:hypothetical protein
MAKSQLRSTREAKKPKQPEKPSVPAKPFSTVHSRVANEVVAKKKTQIAGPRTRGPAITRNL